MISVLKAMLMFLLARARFIITNKSKVVALFIKTGKN
jgi:hypothetical protein